MRNTVLTWSLKILRNTKSTDMAFKSLAYHAQHKITNIAFKRLAYYTQHKY